MAIISILPRGKKLQIAYKLRLLDLALIRSNGPDEVMTRIVGGRDFFVLPASKLRHAMREFVETVQRAVDLSLSCRAQNYCSACPPCWIFGTLGLVGENAKTWSLTSRLDMTEAIALAHGAAVEMRTTNAVDPETMTTGKAGLTRNFAVPAGTEFYGTLTVEAGNADLVRIVQSALLGVSRVGARSAIHGLCTVEILGVRESFMEDPAWSPQIVVETGVVPVGDAPLVSSLLAKGEEDALVEALIRFNKEVVQVAVGKLSGPVNKLSKPVAAVLGALANAETGTIDLKSLMGGLGKLLAGLTDPTAKETLSDISALLKDAGKKNNEEFIKNAVLDAVGPIREVLGSLGLATV